MDAGVEVSSTWEFNRPGNIVLPPTARAKGSLPLEVRGEAIIDIYVARASAAAGIRTGFTIEGGIRLTASNNSELYDSVLWAGLDAFIQTQSPGEGVEEDVYHLIDKNTIAEGAIPI